MIDMHEDNDGVYVTITSYNPVEIMRNINGQIAKYRELDFMHVELTSTVKANYIEYVALILFRKPVEIARNA